MAPPQSFANFAPLQEKPGYGVQQQQLGFGQLRQPDSQESFSSMLFPGQSQDQDHLQSQGFGQHLNFGQQPRPLQEQPIFGLRQPSFSFPAPSRPAQDMFGAALQEEENFQTRPRVSLPQDTFPARPSSKEAASSSKYGGFRGRNR